MVALKTYPAFLLAIPPILSLSAAKPISSDSGPSITSEQIDQILWNHVDSPICKPTTDASVCHLVSQNLIDESGASTWVLDNECNKISREGGAKFPFENYLQPYTLGYLPKLSNRHISVDQAGPVLPPTVHSYGHTYGWVKNQTLSVENCGTIVDSEPGSMVCTVAFQCKPNDKFVSGTTDGTVSKRATPTIRQTDSGCNPSADAHSCTLYWTITDDFINAPTFPPPKSISVSVFDNTCKSLLGYATTPFPVEGFEVHTSLPESIRLMTSAKGPQFEYNSQTYGSGGNTEEGCSGPDCSYIFRC